MVQRSETEVRCVWFISVFLMSSLNRHWAMHGPVTVGCKFFFAVKLSMLCGGFYDSHLCNLAKKKNKKIWLPVIFKPRTDWFVMAVVTRGVKIRQTYSLGTEGTFRKILL